MKNMELHRFRQLEGERIEECFLLPNSLILKLGSGETVIIKAKDGRIVAALDPTD